MTAQRSTTLAILTEHGYIETAREIAVEATPARCVCGWHGEPEHFAWRRKRDHNEHLASLLDQRYTARHASDMPQVFVITDALAGSGTFAAGVVFPDGTCAVRTATTTGRAHTSVWANLDDALASTPGGPARIRWVQ